MHNVNRNFVNNSSNVHKKNTANNAIPNASPSGHKYTGVASVDLAYASMFDNEIARDLKIMGLI